MAARGVAGRGVSRSGDAMHCYASRVLSLLGRVCGSLFKTALFEFSRLCIALPGIVMRCCAILCAVMLCGALRVWSRRVCGSLNQNPPFLNFRGLSLHVESMHVVSMHCQSMPVSSMLCFAWLGRIERDNP